MARDNLTLGLLWHDSSKKSLEEKLIPALAAYNRKFHSWPTVIRVALKDHEDLFSKGEVVIDGREITRDQYVLHNHIHLGVL